MPALWPTGSTVVLLDLALTQIELPQSARGLARHYRVGIAARGYDDPNVVLRVEAFDGIGLRPYPVAHLRFSELTGDLRFDWKRRTRVDGDGWQATEVPLGEESEAYVVRVSKDSAVVSEYGVAQPYFTYTAAMRVQDAISGAFQVSVAQLSTRFGPGPFRHIDLFA